MRVKGSESGGKRKNIWERNKWVAAHLNFLQLMSKGIS